MKTIKRLKFYPELLKLGFICKSYKAGKITYGIGMVLTLKDYLGLKYTEVDTTLIEIEPLHNNRWRIISFDKRIYYRNAFQIEGEVKRIIKQIDVKFKNN
jgi:hypothetical protein